MVNDQQMDGVPILVFEEMKSSHDGGGLTLTAEDRLAKATCGPIDEKGGLSGLPKRLDHIQRVHVVFSSEKQVYIVGDLHRTPHYSILPCQLECFLQSLEVRRLDYNVYHRHRSYVEDGSFIKVYNVGTEEFRGLYSLIKDLRLGEMQSVLNKPPLLVCKRNNYQVSCGYSCQAFQPRSSLANRHESKPALTNATKQHEDKFVIMSRISKKLNLPIACTGKQSSPFNERQAEFAHEIHKNNCYEGLTIGMYSTAGQTLRMHCDEMNATEPIFNLQIVVSEVFLATGSNELSRVFCAAYGRKTVSDYLSRHLRSSNMADVLVTFKTSLPSWRANGITSEILSKAGATVGDLWIRETNADKAIFYSFIADVIVRFFHALSGHSAGHSLNLFRAIELHYVAGILSAHEQFYVITQQWLKDGAPQGSLLLAYLETMVTKYQGAAGGAGQRIQPSFTKPATISRLMRSLVQIYIVVRDLNIAFEKNPLADCAKMFSKAVTILAHKEGVLGVGHLMAQHILSPMVLTGVLKVPPSFSRQAVVAPKGGAASAIKRYIRDVKPAHYSQILKGTASRMKVSPRMVEELLCLLSKDQEKQQKRCEPCIIDQVYRVCLEDPKGNYRLSQISQAQPKWTNCIVPVWCDKTPTSCDTAELPWWTVAWRLDTMLACPVKRNVPFRVVDVLLLDKMIDEHPSAQQIVHVAMCQRISLQSSTTGPVLTKPKSCRPAVLDESEEDDADKVVVGLTAGSAAGKVTCDPTTDDFDAKRQKSLPNRTPCRDPGPVLTKAKSRRPAVLDESKEDDADKVVVGLTAGSAAGKVACDLDGVKGGQQLDHGMTDSPATAQLPHTMTSATPPPCTSQRLARVNAIITQASADKEMVLVDELLDSLEAEKEQFNAIYYDWLASQQAGSVAESCEGSIVAQSDLRPVGVVHVGVSDTNANCSNEDYLNSDETAWELSCNGEVTSNDHCNMDEVVTRVSTNVGGQFTVVWETPSFELYPRIWSLLTMEVRSRIAKLKQELGVSSTEWESTPSNVLCPVLYDKLPPEMKEAVTLAAIMAFHRFMGTETTMHRKKRKRGVHRK